MPTKRVREFQEDQATIGEQLPDEAKGDLDTRVEKPAQPGDVVVKFEGLCWDVIPQPKLGMELEFHVRVKVVGGGERLMANGVTRHHVNARLVGLKPIDAADEIFPSLPLGHYQEAPAE